MLHGVADKPTKRALAVLIVLGLPTLVVVGAYVAADLIIEGSGQGAEHLERGLTPRVGCHSLRHDGARAYRRAVGKR